MNYQELIKIHNNWKGKVCIFGAGDTGKTWAYDLLTSAGFTIDVYGDNYIKEGQEIHDRIKTVSLETLYSYKDNVLVFIAIDNPSVQQNIKAQLIKNGIINIVIMSCFSVLQCLEDLMNLNDPNLNQQFDCLLDDEKFICRKFERLLGYYPNLKQPQTFNEKLQWLKLHDRNPVYTKLVDKYEVKKHVANKIGSEYIIPTLGVYDTFDKIDFNKLPDQFVIKCTHDSGGVVVCKKKSIFNIEEAKHKLVMSLNRNFYLFSREWPYKNVPRKIIVEKYIEDKSGDELTDYKFMCFNGEVKCSFTCTDRFSNNLKVTFFDREWNMMPFERHYPRSETPIHKPKHYNEMLEIAEILSHGIPFVRIDLYEANDKVYFSEYTFFPGSGMEEFSPESWDYILGEWLRLPRY